MAHPPSATSLRCRLRLPPNAPTSSTCTTQPAPMEQVLAVKRRPQRAPPGAGRVAVARRQPRYASCTITLGIQCARTGRSRRSVSWAGFILLAAMCQCDLFGKCSLLRINQRYRYLRSRHTHVTPHRLIETEPRAADGSSSRFLGLNAFKAGDMRSLSRSSGIDLLIGHADDH